MDNTEPNTMIVNLQKLKDELYVVYEINSDKNTDIGNSIKILVDMLTSSIITFFYPDEAAKFSVKPLYHKGSVVCYKLESFHGGGFILYLGVESLKKIEHTQ